MTGEGTVASCVLRPASCLLRPVRWRCVSGSFPARGGCAGHGPACTGYAARLFRALALIIVPTKGPDCRLARIACPVITYFTLRAPARRRGHVRQKAGASGGRSCVSPPWSWPWPCCAVALCMEVGQGQNRERALGEGRCWGPGRFVQGISDISASGMSVTPSRHGGRERAMGIRMGIRKPWHLSPRDRSRLLPPAIARMFSRMFTRTFVLRYPGAVARALPGFLAPLWQEA
ncbi:hypothetical protein ATCC53582_02595 [Novacetimonas hansenii]|nr:hypothetical protein BGC30_04160 [Novacetimonas hansenii]CUW48457.1 hypothetical protein ATCC53582_02595 [Novacetimonas hansenii]